MRKNFKDKNLSTVNLASIDVAQYSPQIKEIKLILNSGEIVRLSYSDIESFKEDMEFLREKLIKL